MADRTWIGGGNNRASNPKDWSPTGVPLPRETVVATQGTIKIEGTELYNPGTLGSSTMQIRGHVDLKLSNGADVMPISVQPQGAVSIDVKDTAKFMLSTFSGSSAVVDIAANSQWAGGFSAFGGSIIINGNHHATFLPSGPSGSTIGDNGPGQVIINADIGLGSGTISAIGGSTVEVGGSVASGQLFEVNAFTDPNVNPALHAPGILKIDHPQQFAGQADLGIGEIDLVGLARADTYTYTNDLLSIFAGGKVIDSLTVHKVASLDGAATDALAVEKTSFGLVVYTVGQSHTSGTDLPLHVS